MHGRMYENAAYGGGLWRVERYTRGTCECPHPESRSAAPISSKPPEKFANCLPLRQRVAFTQRHYLLGEWSLEQQIADQGGAAQVAARAGRTDAAQQSAHGPR